MRTIAISAALSASLISSQAMAIITSQPTNWAPSTTSLPRDAVIGARQSGFHFLPDFICRAKSATGEKYPGILMPYLSSYCNIVSRGMTLSVASYEVLTPAWRSCYTVAACNGTGVPANATYQGGRGTGKYAVPLYFCRADFMGGKHLGTIFPGSNGCAIPWGGAAQPPTKPYDVLVDLSPKLPVTRYPVYASKSETIPLDALVGGYDGDKANLYICLADYNGQFVPGKTRPEFSGCNIPSDGKEISVPDYDVLVPLWTDPAIASYSFPVTLGANSYVCHQPFFLSNGESIPIGPGESQGSLTSCLAADISEGDPILPTSVLPPLTPYRVLSE
jgi:hypothetical protein